MGERECRRDALLSFSPTVHMCTFCLALGKQARKRVSLLFSSLHLISCFAEFGGLFAYGSLHISA